MCILYIHAPDVGGFKDFPGSCHDFACQLTVILAPLTTHHSRLDLDGGDFPRSEGPFGMAESLDRLDTKLRMDFMVRPRGRSDPLP